MPHDSAIVIPTKQFVVSMLTRDITLKDAAPNEKAHKHTNESN